MTLEEHKGLARRYFEELANNGDLAVAAEILAPEAIAPVQQLISMLHILVAGPPQEPERGGEQTTEDESELFAWWYRW
jgi:hypothetical protein